MTEGVKRISFEKFIRAVFHTVILKGWQIVGTAVEGDGQATARRDLAEQNVRKRPPAFRARIEELHDRIAKPIRFAKIDAAAADVDEHGRLSDRGNAPYQFLLTLG